VITPEQLNSVLLEACPSFAEPYRASLETWGDDLPSAIRSDFVHHLLELQQQNRREEFPAVARAIERLHVEGDDEVRETATIGILESIQNIWGNNGADPADFCRFLLPKSRRWWDELNAFWRGERHYVGEGLQKQMTEEDIAQVRKDIQAFNERRRREQQGGVS
jgi:hypothetical protein